MTSFFLSARAIPNFAEDLALNKYELLRSRCSQSAPSISSVINRRLPTPFAGALVEAKWQRLDLIASIERSLQQAFVAI
jgi:hypothetical protein